jgi:hypothetical protein
MTVKHVRKISYFLLMVVSGRSCSKYVATAEIVKEADYVLDSFNGGSCVDTGKTMHCLLSDIRLCVDFLTKASMG